MFLNCSYLSTDAINVIFKTIFKDIRAKIFQSIDFLKIFTAVR